MVVPETSTNFLQYILMIVFEDKIARYADDQLARKGGQYAALVEANILRTVHALLGGLYGRLVVHAMGGTSVASPSSEKNDKSS